MEGRFRYRKQKSTFGFKDLIGGRHTNLRPSRISFHSFLKIAINAFFCFFSAFHLRRTKAYYLNSLSLAR
ncbi:hypothetical protein DB43_FG00350 [Parachlamydia acanthamoebae]|uniref:Uncharacterized protein n=1 Tax=Parachlamydia acanthamoebae TaxID=83552 RepID=A0A0C1C353_9BACT|nr:hypothetical protein DB43_FG00350 [Parachlamydia acanthamoebae]